ncbi:hypothetical protein BD413DRAFT_494346 [Trametes elegans]|nr:hypothetical protein BD413DRAFT_494346 [Trametes elegans]
MSAVSDVLCTFRRLSTVQVNPRPITVSAFLHLAQLPKLQRFEATIDACTEQKFLAAFDNARDKGYFPRLRSLGLGVWRHLGIVKVTAYVPEEDDAVPLDTLAPLLSPKELTHALVNTAGRFSPDNDALFTMATSWPLLRRLELGPDKADHPPESRPSLAGLVPFAQTCPNLSALAVALNTNIERVPFVLRLCPPSLGFSQRRLTALSVGRSPIEDAYGVAAFLSDIFPVLCDIERNFRHEEELFENEVETEEERTQILADAVHSGRWGKLKRDYIPLFAKIRQQERSWVEKNGKIAF